MLMNEQEAGAAALCCPSSPSPPPRPPRSGRCPWPRTRAILEELAGRALLVDIERRGESVYALPPPMAGFFEFSLMRTRGDIDQKALSELFHQYLNVEEDFVKALFTEGETQLGRVFVQEPVLTSDQAAHVLDYERASEVIHTASHIGVGMCYCRHKMQHLGRACDAPMDICMTFNGSAESLIKHGHARAIEAAECLDLLDEAYERGLVQFGENVQERVNFICNCCGCCCEAMIAARRFAHLHPGPHQQLPARDRSGRLQRLRQVRGGLSGGGPVPGLGQRSGTSPRRKAARLDPEVCLGCGVCVPACDAGEPRT